MPPPLKGLGCSNTPGSIPIATAVCEGKLSRNHGAHSSGSNDYQAVSGQTSGWHARSPGLILGLKLPLVVVVLAVAVVGAGPMGVLAQETGEDDSGSGGTGVGKSILNYLIIIVLVAASGLFSGLTLGLLGLDKIGLEIISNGDEPRMAAFAKVCALLLPAVRKGCCARWI